MAESKLTCCNPFNIPRHAWGTRKKNQRFVTEWMCEKAPNISIGSKICDTCRRKLQTTPIEKLTDDPVEFDAGDDSHEIEGTISDFDESHTAEGSSPSATAAYVDSTTAISSLNKYLAEVGMTPYTNTKASQPYYLDKKMKEITESMKQLILSEPGDDDSEMIRQ